MGDESRLELKLADYLPWVVVFSTGVGCFSFAFLTKFPSPVQQLLGPEMLAHALTMATFRVAGAVVFSRMLVSILLCLFQTSLSRYLRQAVSMPLVLYRYSGRTVFRNLFYMISRKLFRVKSAVRTLPQYATLVLALIIFPFLFHWKAFVGAHPAEALRFISLTGVVIIILFTVLKLVPLHVINGSSQSRPRRKISSLEFQFIISSGILVFFYTFGLVSADDMYWTSSGVHINHVWYRLVYVSDDYIVIGKDLAGGNRGFLVRPSADALDIPLSTLSEPMSDR